MATIQYPNTSPYAITTQNDWRLGRYAHRKIIPAKDDILVTIDQRYHNRPDKLSYDLYGVSSYYWVFMLRNMDLIRDPIWDLRAGMRIYAPAIASLQKVLG